MLKVKLQGNLVVIIHHFIVYCIQTPRRTTAGDGYRRMQEHIQRHTYIHTEAHINK